MTTRSKATAVTASLLAVLGLAGCGFLASPVPFSDLTRERTEADALPELHDFPPANVDPESSRYVGEHEGVRLWLAEPTQVDGVCLIVVRTTDTDWVAGCSGGSGVRLGGAGGSFEVRPDRAPVPDDATRVSENVYVLGSSR
ncbi:hypothetical protein [Microbacterium album]|uniref:Lipoprotein n=1 Tax=Microbacterium album TaxID=2053191 RepID=A0A917IBT0_9MICO|nr:hypothetical protein [Microbacterium album]GGH36514.1 hypothetical protein GCM10010921_05710 [Microbacterium album]